MSPHLSSHSQLYKGELCLVKSRLSVHLVQSPSGVREMLKCAHYAH